VAIHHLSKAAESVDFAISEAIRNRKPVYIEVGMVGQDVCVWGGEVYVCVGWR
jgi:TPP-dependent 2-oxoacid decarboxylase